MTEQTVLQPALQRMLQPMVQPEWPDIRVTRLETIPMHVPLRNVMRTSAGAWPFVEVLLLRIHTDAGIVGLGETQAWRRQGSAETFPNLIHNIEHFYAPRIVGRSPFEIAAIMTELDNVLDHSYYSKAPISDALYDIQGKALGCPVYQLLGGRCRDELHLCAPIGLQDDRGQLLERAAILHERGFRSFLLKIGVDAKSDYENIKGLRERLGPDVKIRVDANGSMSFDESLALLKRLEPLDIASAEQPLAPWDLDGMAALAARVNMPIMADESCGDVHDVVNLIRARAATVIQTKQSKNGGLWNVRKVWTVAAAAGMQIYPGNHACTGVNSAAVAHLATAWPGESLVDGPFAMGATGEVENDIVTSSMQVKNGKLSLGDAPGLGLILDEDVVERYRVKVQ